MTGDATCPRFGKLLRGCRFEARYDASPEYGKYRLSNVGADELLAFFHGTTAKRYVRDVCVRCGKTVDRAKATA